MMSWAFRTARRPPAVSATVFLRRTYEEPQLAPAPLGGHGETAGYLTKLLAAAPADVRERLAEIGEFTLDKENLDRMRGQRLRDPGTPSGAVEHADLRVPGGPGDPDVPIRLHRERGTVPGTRYPATRSRRAPRTWRGCRPRSSPSATSTACSTRTSITRGA
jgi:hypothetical protein